MVVYLPMRTYGVNRHFDLLKAFGVIEKVSLNPFFFFGKDLLYNIRA